MALKTAYRSGHGSTENDHIGHPSCEGGIGHGTPSALREKIQRRMAGGGRPDPIRIERWTVHAGTAPYLGTMTQNGQTIIASQVGEFKSIIFRDPKTKLICFLLAVGML